MNQNQQDIVTLLQIIDVSVLIIIIMQLQVNQMFNLCDL